MQTSFDHVPAAPSRVADKQPIVAVLAACALCFLAVAVLEAGFASSLAKVGWVTLTIATAAIDPGTGVALYLAGAAVYTPRHFEGWGSFEERPDNYAVVGLVLAFCFSLLATGARPRAGRVQFLAGMLVVYALLVTAAQRGIDRAMFVAVMHSLGLPLLLFVVLAVGRRQRSDLATPLGVLLTLGAYMAWVSLLQAAGAHSLIRPAWIADPSINTWLDSGRSTGPLMQAAFNGLALTLTAILCMGLGWSGGLGRRAVAWAASGLMIGGIFVCYTRGPWLGAVLAGGVLAVAGSGAGQKWRVIVRLGILLSLLVILVQIPSRFAQERTRDSGTVEFRFKLWAAALEMAAERPLFGYGIGEFKEQVDSFRDYTGDVKPPRGGLRNVTHNAFLSVLVELGGIGLLLYCATIWGVLREGLRGARLMFPSRGVALVLALSVAYFFNGLFVTLQDPFTNCLYFGSMGLFAGGATGQGST